MCDHHERCCPECCEGDYGRTLPCRPCDALSDQADQLAVVATKASHDPKVAAALAALRLAMLGELTEDEIERLGALAPLAGALNKD